MDSWPATQTDWKLLTGRLRDGDLVCVVHGLVDAVSVNELPVCPVCAQLLSRAVRDRRTAALTGFTEPWPRVCPAGHHLGDGDRRLSWRSCGCRFAVPGPGGHRTWQCRSCPDADPMLYPPCAAPVDEPIRPANL